MEITHLKSAFEFAWHAQTIYDVHQPKAFRFLGEVIEDRRHFYAFDEIEQLRRSYLSNPKLLTLEDHGAGSRTKQSLQRSIRDIVQSSGSPKRFGKYLFRTVDWLQPKTVLELGTNLGIGTAYLAAALPTSGRLISIDADAQLLDLAQQSLQQILPHAETDLRLGTFADQLPQALADLGQVDLAFIDGHHEQQATCRYYRQIKPFINASSVLIFDDIHWSPGMERAWMWLREQPEVRLSVDLYRWGILFFSEEILHPQHLNIVPWHFKPWHMGFFSARSISKS